MNAAMDRRQRKTRASIFKAFGELLAQKNYNRITVQEIIDRADIGRTTFYAHFETKDELLKGLCEELFSHVIESTNDLNHTHGLYSNNRPPESVFCHLLQHLQENENNILGLLSSESGDLFLRYFKNSLNQLLTTQLIGWTKSTKHQVPYDFLINHISSTFVEMVQWWLKGGQKQTPEQLTVYFETVIKPMFSENF